MDLVPRLRDAILAQSLPPPSQAFLTQLVTSRTPPPPLPSLVATAKARLLASDITTSQLVDGSMTSLPEFSPQAKEIRLSYDVHLQVLDIEDLNKSRWSQAEELEAIERGEMTRGREVIRVTAEDESSPSNTSTASNSAGNATHRLVLQDRSGRKVFAIELTRVPKIAVGKTSIGEKILIRAGAVIARATILLTMENCLPLGGKVDAWQKQWTEKRLTRLKSGAAGGQTGP